MSRELICPVCSSDCETFPLFFFLECRNAQIMWRLSPIGYVPDMNGDASIFNWFDKLIDRWKGTARSGEAQPDLGYNDHVVYLEVSK